MILQQIVAVLTAERNLLDRAIAALDGISTRPRRGRPPKAVLQTSARPKRRRRMSAAARTRGAAAQRARLAKVRAQKKAA